MNTAALAQSGYARTNAISPLPRSSEYRAFAEVTRRLTKAAEDGPFAKLAEAVYLNQKLWLILATDVAGAENGLPEQLRAQIFYLSEFVRIHSPKVLKDEASADILVEINTAIMRGLNPTSGDES